MRRSLLIPLLAAGWALGAAELPAHAGGCMCWMNDGSASDCYDSAGGQADCDNHCAGWDHAVYLDGTAACEGPDNTLPVVYDNDGTRWRYVVVIDQCRIQGNECQEHHCLWRCAQPAGTEE